MASRSPRPLPPSPSSRARVESDASNSSDSSEHVSVFPHASGAMQINDGEFSAIKGSRYGHLQIVINQGGPRDMHSSRVGHRKPQGPSAGSVSGPRSATIPRVARPRTAGGDVGIEMLSELAEQFSQKCKKREQRLDDREAELDARERDLIVRSEKIQMWENDLRRKERQLATLKSDIQEREEGLDYAEHKLSLMKDNLLLREDLVKDAIEDLRERERVFEEQRAHARTCSSEFNTLSVTCSVASRATSMLPAQAPAPQLISPNRRPLSTTSAISPLPAIVEKFSEVRVTHRQLTSRPPSPILHSTWSGRALPLAPRPAVSSDREFSGNEWDGLSDVSSSDDLPGSEDELDDFPGEEEETESDRPPTYHTFERPGPNLPSEPFNFELVEKLRAALFSTLKMSPKDDPSPEATISVSTSFSGTILREHVDDIASIDDQAERARAISWAIGMMVETGRFDEGTVRTLCERVSEDEPSADVAVRALKKDLERTHLTLIQLYALRLLRMMLANTNSTFHEQCSSPHFMDALEEIESSDETNPAVRERTWEVIEAIRKGRSAFPLFALGHVDVARVYEGFATPGAYGVAY